MKLTKKLETEIWKIYDTWMQGYLNADVETYNSYFDDKYHFIGSTNNEEFLNKKDTTEFFKVTGDQFSGIMDLRNESKTLEQFEDHIFLTHICDTWFKNDVDWSYYGRFRLSSILHNTKDGWKFIYQHFSMPDAKSEEGQTIGFDKVHLENQELREAIQRRTIELEKKNRELEVETSLERIRAQAVAMKSSSDLLDIVVTMRNEFIKLGHEAHYFWHMMWLPKKYEKAMTSGDGSKIGFVMELPGHIHGDIPLLAKWEKSKKPTVVYAMNVEEAINYVDKMVALGDFKNIDPQAPTHDDIRHIGGLTFIMARTSHGEIGYSLPGIVKNPPKEDLNILIQFAGAFDLAHRRFLDLQKAEKQAREVQIELALEKVRSRTMAMQHSDELADASYLLDCQIRALGIKTRGCAFNIYGENESTEWFSSEMGTMPTYKTPRENIFLRNYEEGQKGKSMYIKSFSGEACAAHYDYLCTIPVMGEALKEFKKNGGSFPTQQIDHVTYFKYGYLLFITLEPVPEAHDIFKRFAKVFEQTYTRFLDLQKAEAQAREAQIETALERVRSRTMAMQNSKELGDVILEVLKKLQDLDISMEHRATAIFTFEAGNKDYEQWVASPEYNSILSFNTPYFDHPVQNDIWHARQNETEFYAKSYTVEEKNSLFNYIFELPALKDMPQAEKTKALQFNHYSISIAFQKHAALVVVDHSGIPLTEGENSILRRLNKVFNQTYTRFLDLQKSEAQARESQIELGLERVRARAMAMQHSNELSDLVATVLNELTKLDFSLTWCIINIINEVDHSNMIWAINPEGGTEPESYYMKFEDYPYHHATLKAWKAKKTKFVYILEGKEKKIYDDYLYNETEFKKFSNKAKKANRALDRYVASFTFSNFGGLQTISSEPLSEENLDILARFGNVFDMTYTRFNDLQKAEAQAREAQIEAALEKVRSRTMAMQRSDELPEAANTLFLEVQALGIPAWSCGYNILSDDKKSSICNMSSEGKLQDAFLLPLTQHKSLKPWHKAIINEEEFFVYGQKGKDLVAHYKYMESLPELKGTFELFEKAGIKLPTQQFNHLVRFNEGFLLFITYEEVPEAHDIFKRFGKVFEQTYTRFLDLKKAEAQARESEIELALERVRARTMAMQKSEEIGDVAFILFQQLKSLGGNLWGTGFGFCKTDSDTDEYWFANEKGIMPQLIIPNTIDPAHKEMYQGWKNNLEFHSIEKGGKELKAHYKYMLTVPDVQPIFQGMLDDGIAFPKWQKWHAAYFKYGYLLVITTETYENEDIFKRFAKVFEQTYIRFLDLQKAEAQAREAQIETALERVRSRSMAMQKSNELLEAGELLWNEITKLGIDCFTSGYVIMDETEDIGWNYTPNPSTGKILEQAIGIPHKQTPPMREIAASWKKQEPLCVIELTRKQTIAHQTFVAEKGINFPFSAKQLVEISPKEIVLHTFNFKQGYLLIVGGETISKDHIDLMLRFTKVFQQTYTRFLDLKKAEAQAREAKIEAALERTRTQSMLMQHSDELNVTAQVFHQQLQLLGIDSEFSYLWLPDDREKTHKFWATWSDTKKNKTIYNNKTVSYPLDKNEPSIAACYVAWESDETVHVNTVPPDEVNEYFNTWSELLSGVEKFKPELFPNGLYYVDAYMKYGCFGIMIKRQLNKDEKNILSRFSNEFQRTYTRFLDLQKAEAQVREAQIEAALEKVRSRTMAMQKGEEVKDVVVLLYKELIALGVTNFATCGYVEINEKTNRQETWVTNPGGDSLGLFYLPLTGDVHFDARYEAWKNKQTVFHQTVAGKERRKHLEYAITTFNSKEAEEMVLTQFPDPTVFYCFNFSHGYLHLVCGSYLNKEEESLLARFTRVFEQTYARFLDLKKAEAQAREAQIENALEKVRSRSLAMHKPDELQEVITVVAEKLQELGVIFDVGGVILCTYFPDNKDVVHWIASPDLSSSQSYYVPYFDNPIFSEAWDSKIQGDAYFSKEFQVEAKNHFFEYAFENSDYRHFPEDYKQHVLEAEHHRLSAAWSKNSAILIPSLTGAVPSESDADIMKRFAKVFEQAYIRFMDLQKAEAQTRQAKIESALERVRARALAMHNPEELKEVADVLRTEMGMLGVEELETCSIYINDESNRKTECWYALKDISLKKKKLLIDNFELNLKDTWVGKQMQRFYKSKEKKTSIVMTGKNRKEWIHYCEAQSKHLKGYYGTEIPDRTYHLYKFSHGAIGVATAGNISDENWDLLKRASSVFSLAYSRFKDLTQARFDLQRLKEEKKKAEEALSELQLTQKQLVQSEKMASLGELTAGIAHEIQNPLNFVNNFSEVSKELLDEMLEEIENGDLDEAKTIMTDVIQNLEKINHHGKRADGIVKGMLQHSRASGNKKEPTDINALADEYFRLAYHGLRAKDKSFNANIETDYDDNIKTVDVIPQDIGRVILNLFTNAFYAVDEKKSNSKSKVYKPTVSVSTKKSNEKVIIVVKDNGNGIPNHIIDKIFQPFFTTKPTGKGTGLGLSMSYDIIKAHEGELTVDTKEREGTTFSIILPIKPN